MKHRRMSLYGSDGQLTIVLLLCIVYVIAGVTFLTFLHHFQQPMVITMLMCAILSEAVIIIDADK